MSIEFHSLVPPTMQDAIRQVAVKAVEDPVKYGDGAPVPGNDGA